MFDRLNRRTSRRQLMLASSGIAAAIAASALISACAGPPAVAPTAPAAPAAPAPQPTAIARMPGDDKLGELR